MITQALTFISSKINVTFETIFNGRKVILGNVATLNDVGSNESNVLLSLINIEEEVLLRNPENYTKRYPSVIYKNPPMHFNITIIFGAYHPQEHGLEDNYLDSINKIQTIIGFFQSQSIYDHNNTTDLDFPVEIEKLNFELVSLNLEQLHHLWSMLGGKYIPSVVYKMRMVVIDQAKEERRAPLISQVVIDDKIKYQQ